MTTSCLHQYATIGEARVARKLVKAALDRELSVSVYDGEEWTVTKAWRLKTVLDALATTGEDTLRMYAPTGDCVGTFYLVYGNEEDGSCLIADHTDNDICQRMFEAAQPVDA
jgi:hypothetical protein